MFVFSSQQMLYHWLYNIYLEYILVDDPLKVWGPSGLQLHAGGPSGLFTSSFSFSPQGDLVQLYFIISFWQTSKYKKWQIIFSKLIYKDILSPQYGQMEQIFLFRNVLKWYICSMGLVQMGFVQLGIVQMGVVHTMHCLIISREGLILTLSILHCPQGRIFFSTLWRKIDDERMFVLHQDSGGIGKSILSALALRPRKTSRVSGNLSGVEDGFPNTSLVLVEHGYNPHTSQFDCWTVRGYMSNGKYQMSNVELQMTNVIKCW